MDHLFITKIPILETKPNHYDTKVRSIATVFVVICSFATFILACMSPTYNSTVRFLARAICFACGNLIVGALWSFFALSEPESDLDPVRYFLGVRSIFNASSFLLLFCAVSTCLNAVFETRFLLFGHRIVETGESFPTAEATVAQAIESHQNMDILIVLAVCSGILGIVLVLCSKCGVTFIGQRHMNRSNILTCSLLHLILGGLIVAHCTGTPLFSTSLTPFSSFALSNAFRGLFGFQSLLHVLSATYGIFTFRRTSKSILPSRRYKIYSVANVLPAICLATICVPYFLVMLFRTPHYLETHSTEREEICEHYVRTYNLYTPHTAPLAFNYCQSENLTKFNSTLMYFENQSLYLSIVLLVFAGISCYTLIKSTSDISALQTLHPPRLIQSSSTVTFIVGTPSETPSSLLPISPPRSSSTTSSTAPILQHTDAPSPPPQPKKSKIRFVNDIQFNRKPQHYTPQTHRPLHTDNNPSPTRSSPMSSISLQNYSSEMDSISVMPNSAFSLDTIDEEPEDEPTTLPASLVRSETV
ncbi:hypothetical protein BLNAU_10258 [Blattamonas nauphoetae]|uniref:Transmembrane protein n=1 Tax=Blattamonas nauphoetae TaxID=2049346 RepID=A0ABQ9XTG5_9EUKA|nr:hypothetical protein BLNAU_10258 [Blattamonas nauphoetae]